VGSKPATTIEEPPLQAGAAEPASPGRRRSGPLGGQEATRSERPWGPHYLGRFAPSPTGPLHAGSLVAALASWLDARAHGGRWLVRIEDVDGPRCVAGSDQTVLAQLAACGLLPDEAPVYQSQRGNLYQTALDQLIAQGLAYPCACTRQEIALAMQTSGRPVERHGELVYPGTCRGRLQGRAPRSWRFLTADLASNRPLAQELPARAAINSIATDKSAIDASPPVSGANVIWHDRRLGTQTQSVSHEVGDFVLKRADGPWAYQLAVVVDDAAQGVTHIVRGEDLANNTARQILLQQALGLKTPAYLHTPLVLGANGEKLSKQNSAQPLDLSRPVGALQAAAQVLGLAGNALAAMPAEWLRQAVPQWAALCAHQAN
jgi:glutamyl-Q tRNA(Asp) synthetase